MPSRHWTSGDFLVHRFNPDLGVGRVRDLHPRAIIVEFPRAGLTLRLARDNDALRPVHLNAGRPVRLLDSGEHTAVVERLPDGTLSLANGQTASSGMVWPLELEGALLERLALGELDDTRDFVVRWRMLRLLAIREAGGMGSFLGGRIRLFPHQLYVAERASASDPVRWLLADEVGLGKTIEAALILNRLVHTGRVERCLIVVPEALTVQWLGELWRKYHHVFTLLDGARLADVERDFGRGFNPFDVHRRVVIALETLVDRPELTDAAVRARVDLLVVDEAQRLRRPPGHPGEPGWRAVAPIAAGGRHVLLLSATPLEDDAHGFFRLLQLLRPDAFPDDMSVEARLADGAPLPPCTSSTRRADIGGLPPRAAIPVDIDATAWARHADLERTLRGVPAPHAVAERQKVDRIRRAASSGAALRSGLAATPAEQALRALAGQLDARDPRVAWLLARAPRWKDANEKTLVFVAYRETLDMLRTTLADRARVASGVFHEELSAARRDTEVARFREPDGPSILVSTECGGEGRNFEFCRRLVLFDLPWKPTTVEQRIGRLDRIGRSLPVDIVYFRPPSGIGRDVVRLLETLGVFREPLAALEPQLAGVEAVLEQVAADPGGSLDQPQVDAVLSEARAARTRVHEAAYRQLHQHPYRPEMASSILARIPAGLDALNEETVVSASERLGFAVERQRGRRTFSIGLGEASLVDGLPGVPGGSTFVGSFDREEAVGRETIDFFASGHPLVEGLFSFFDDSPLGRVARFEISLGSEEHEGVIAFYRTPSGFEVVAIDRDGGPRPEWAAVIQEMPPAVRPVRTPDTDRSWTDMVRRVGGQLDPTRRPEALAAVIVRPQR